MRILLDTHTFIWMISDEARLPASTLDMLKDSSNEVFFSAVVSWEIAVKRAKGRLGFVGSPQARARKIGLLEMPILAEHCEAAAELPPHHRDPFDRLLIAQAMEAGLVLATRDAAMARYGIRTLRA